MDTIPNRWGPDEAPDYLVLCARRAASDGGGESFVIDLPSAIERMEPAPEMGKHLASVEILQSFPIIAGMDRLGLNRTDIVQGMGDNHGGGVEEDDGPVTFHRVEKLILANPFVASRTVHRFSSYVEVLLDQEEEAERNNNNNNKQNTGDSPATPAVRPSPSSTDPETDMAAIRSYARAVADAAKEAARFLVLPGECQIIDNYRTAHGREPYVDLERALWQVFIWTDAALAIPDDPGPGRRWMIHPSVDVQKGSNLEACQARVDH